MSLFKRAAARGVAHELVRQGVIAFPSKEAMDEAADMVGDAAQMPDVSGEQGQAPEDVAAIANQLIELANALMAQAGQGGAKTASELQKFASVADLEKVAGDAALAVMEKAASEAKQASAEVPNTNNDNTLRDAAKTDEMAEKDLKDRPLGKYVVGQGETKFETNQAMVGQLTQAPGVPTPPAGGKNSVNDDVEGVKNVKSSAEALRTLGTSYTPNTLQNAAKWDPLAKKDLKDRPLDKYNVGRGNTNFGEGQDARVGKEVMHVDPTLKTPRTSNSAMDASKSKATNPLTKSSAEEEQAFVTLFRKCAEDVGPYLPKNLSEDQKIAAISQMIGYDRDGRQSFLTNMHKAAEEAAADAKTEEKKDEAPAEAAAEKKEEKADDTKKESALLDQIRQIAAGASQARA